MTDLHTGTAARPDGPEPGPADDTGAAHVLERLSALDRFLPVWIGAAMAARLLFGGTSPASPTPLETVKIGQTTLPIAVGLLLMMYPVLAKVRYDEAAHITADADRQPDLQLAHRAGADVHPGLAAARPQPAYRANYSRT